MKKKAIRKLLAALLAVAMLCAMAVPAFAADNTYTITIGEGAVGTYEAYQIFTGTLSESGDVLSNIAWGTGITEEGKAAMGDAATMAATITDAKAFANELDSQGYLSTVTTGTYDSSTHKITGLPAGYYLIKNTAGSVSGNEAYTDFIVSVVKDVTVNPKSDKPTLEKKVQDTNDSTGDTTGWQDSADYDVNDDVPFQLKTTLVNNFADYSSYKLVFHDVQSAGLTFNANTVKVTVDGKELAADEFTVEQSTGDDCTFHIVITDVKALASVTAKAGDEVVVTYTSTLNDKAVMGAEGNPNTAHLEYSNNPHNTTDTGKTPDDKVTVFTFNITANKVDGNSQPLGGAAFALYKLNKTTGKYELVGLQNATLNADGTYTIADPDAKSFTWNRIDDGEYKLVEIITPDGYNTITDQYFTVTAAHDVTSDDPQLGSVSGTALDGSSITFTATENNAGLSTSIVNQRGATLPSTGGIGTTLFYVIGGGLMVAAVVLLVTKKRMENK